MVNKKLVNSYSDELYPCVNQLKKNNYFGFQAVFWFFRYLYI